MSDKVMQVQEEALAAIEQATTLEQLQQVKIQYLGKKGSIQALMSEMKALPQEEKPAFGQKVNVCKDTVAKVLESKEEVLKIAALAGKLEAEKIDITLAGDTHKLGTTHPLVMIQQEIEDLFLSMGYKVAEGPEVEQDYYNFELANTPKDHPARDMQDTFYIDPNTLLRTHTTAMQMRELELSLIHIQMCIRDRKYTDCDNLWWDLQNGLVADLLLSDIQMENMTGIELARKMRQARLNHLICFISGVKDFVFEGYDVDALAYLLKPYKKDQLFKILDKAIKQLHISDEFSMISSKKEVYKI